MKQPESWEELARRARQAYRVEDRAAPAGFADRVVRAAWQAGRTTEPWDALFAWRAVAVAAALTAIVVGLNLNSLRGWVDTEAAALSESLTEIETLDVS